MKNVSNVENHIPQGEINETQGNYNRLYDSDIFVMSENTFDDDMISKSSRRVSAGTNNNGRPTFKNEFLNFVDNS